jgi:hypothetical protein
VSCLASQLFGYELKACAETQERAAESEESVDDRESVSGQSTSMASRLPNLTWISDAFDRAMSTNLLQKDVEQIAPIVLARAGFEKRLLEDDKAGQSFDWKTHAKLIQLCVRAGEDSFKNLINILKVGIVSVRRGK